MIDPSHSEKVAFAGQDRHSAITITICVKAHRLIGHVPKDETLKGCGYRILVIESYLVFYVIRGRTIEIHRVVHGPEIWMTSYNYRLMIFSTVYNRANVNISRASPSQVFCATQKEPFNIRDGHFLLLDQSPGKIFAYKFIVSHPLFLSALFLCHR